MLHIYPSHIFILMEPHKMDHVDVDPGFTSIQNNIIRYSGGKCINMRVDSIALWALLWFSRFLDIQSILIFGDSQALINHMLGVSSISDPHIQGWFHNIEYINRSFHHISFQHIHREYSYIVDAMSKHVISARVGCFRITLLVVNIIMAIGTQSLLGWIFICFDYLYTFHDLRCSMFQAGLLSYICFFCSLRLYIIFCCWTMDIYFG